MTYYEITDAQRLVSALSEVFEFSKPLTDKFATIHIKRPISCFDGKGLIESQVLFLHEDDSYLYTMEIDELTKTGFSGNIIRVDTPYGPLSLEMFLNCILNDPALAEFIDQEAFEAATKKIDGRDPTESDRATLDRVSVKRAQVIPYPIDKVNSTIWGLLECDTAKEIMLKAEKSGSTKEINILYSIDFEALVDDVKITKKLTAFDKRVYLAVAALYDAGNSVITLRQIYFAMGYTGRPGSNDLTRINESITKMLGANIFISNEQEAGVYAYDKFIYKGSLLPYEQIEAVANGQLVDAAIHLFREPPVIAFAKQRKQVTTIDVKLLQSPISKTDGNLSLDDYLITRISRAKTGKQPHRILYKTLYEKTGITEKKQRQRATDKIQRYLEHYKKCGMIARYTMEADGVTVYFDRKKIKASNTTAGQKSD